jgi:hypothetical protein
MVSVAGMPSCPSLDLKHNYLLHNHTLESVSSVKYLGINLQSGLKWTQHTNNIVANANKSLGFLKRNLWSISVTLLVLLYRLQAYLAARHWTISILLSFYIQTSSCIQRSIQVLILSEHNHLLEFTTSKYSSMPNSQHV